MVVILAATVAHLVAPAEMPPTRRPAAGGGKKPPAGAGRPSTTAAAFNNAGAPLGTDKDAWVGLSGKVRRLLVARAAD